MRDQELRLIGKIIEVSRGGLYVDRQERVTVQVDGAEPLYAELRLPNERAWAIGQEVLISIVPARPREALTVAQGRASEVPSGWS